MEKTMEATAGLALQASRESEREWKQLVGLRVDSFKSSKLVWIPRVARV